jgi:putative ABC transport system permease protein
VMGREHQTSHQMLDAEIQEQRLIGRVLPAIFLAVAAFLLQGVVSRLVGIQREQIATLKALGYGEGAILWHYLQWVGVIVVLGLLMGIGVAQVFGRWLTALYAEFFRFPSFHFQMPLDVVLQALGLTAGAAALGTWQVIAATARLPPAVAMSPPAPAVYRPSWADRWGWKSLPLGPRRVLRQIQRRPWRTALATASIAASVGIVILGNFVRDAMALIVDTQFNQAQRADVQLWTMAETPAQVAADLLHQPGVWRAEGVRMMAVRLVHGAARERVLLRGLQDDARLNQVVDVDQRVVAVTGEGLTLTDRLAAKLGLQVGQMVEVELLEGAPRTLRLRVDATVADMMGLNAVARRSVLHRALDESPIVNSVALGVDRDRIDELLEALQAMPRVAGAFSKAKLLSNMETFSARNVRIMSGVMTLFAVVIAVGVVYNQARMALSERRWELASLRVLGFTQAEVAAFLLGELAVVVVLAMPLGLLVGRGLVHGLAGWMRSDQFAFPVVILPRTDAWAIVCVLVTALASAWIVRRQIDRLDLVAALKTRE